jgi:hypothetical protein
LGLKAQILRVRKKVKNAFSRNYQQAKRIEKLGNQLYQLSGGKVFAGIFAAMKLPNIPAVTKRPNIIVGSYESDIHQALLDAVLWKPEQVINIGSAEGYFAVGLARLLKDQIPVYAFEIEQRHWENLSAFAEVNKIRNSIRQKGLCTIDELNAINPSKAFVLIDCEGCEVNLLDPVAVPSLKTAFIICELHDFIDPTITPSLVERFSESHNIDIIYEKEKITSAFRILEHLPKQDDKELSIAEFRQINGIPDQGRWFVAIPKQPLK